MPHNQLRFNLLHRIHRHADHNQERGAAEVEIDIQPVQQPDRQMRVKPAPPSRPAGG